MTGLLTAFGLGLLGLSFLGVYRIAKGPTSFDRIVGAGFIGTLAVVLLLVVGFLYGRPDLFVDIALMYSLLAFVGTLVYAKYLLERGDR